MKTIAPTARRTLGVLGVGAVSGGALVWALSVAGPPDADAAQDPCAASQVAKTVGSVATSFGYYLDSHPETNVAFTTISQQQQGPQALASLKSYLDANPQVGKDLQNLQSPLVALSSRCTLPVTLPQLLGLMQAGAAQSAPAPGVGPASGLPGLQPNATPPTLPGAVGSAPTAGAPVATRAVGTPPGPSSASAG